MLCNFYSLTNIRRVQMQSSVIAISNNLIKISKYYPLSCVIVNLQKSQSWKLWTQTKGTPSYSWEDNTNNDWLYIVNKRKQVKNLNKLQPISPKLDKKGKLHK